MPSRLPSAVTTLILLALALRPGVAADPPVKFESFDRDPGWEGINNRLVPKVFPTATQDFGYSPTNIAGRDPGELGGRVWRASTPASYGAVVAPAKTLDDALSAAGTFAITASTGSSGVFFGW